MNKRGQDLPITTIIIAALGIILLVVVAAIFSGKIGTFGRASSECPGVCYKSSQSADMTADEFSSFFKQGTGCNPQFETKLSGTYLPRGIPKDKDLSTWSCTACCVQTA